MEYILSRIRGLLILGFVLFMLGGAMEVWDWLNPKPKREPGPPPPPPVADSFEADVYSISKVTRGSSFSHYEIKFSRATNGQDDLKYYQANSDEELRPFVGSHVTVNCNRSENMKTCFWLTRMQSGDHLINQK